jgi:hypothetical protein
VSFWKDLDIDCHYGAPGVVVRVGLGGLIWVKEWWGGGRPAVLNATYDCLPASGPVIQVIA